MPSKGFVILGLFVGLSLLILIYFIGSSYIDSQERKRMGTQKEKPTKSIQLCIHNLLKKESSVTIVNKDLENAIEEDDTKIEIEVVSQ